MGWAIGYVDGRDVGYGVPATCEQPSCKKKIDRGLSYACGGFPSNEYGCGLFFCEKHMFGYEDEYGEWHQACDVCTYNGELGGDRWREFKKPYGKKPDRPVWLRWKLKHPSWREWREKYPEEVEEIKTILGIIQPCSASPSSPATDLKT
jgi:hypothetical protein